MYFEDKKVVGTCPKCGHEMYVGKIDYGWRDTPYCTYCGYEELCTDYNGKCGNCHKRLGDDEYCRYCGTRRGEGEFKPYKNVSYCIYGPAPRFRIHTCNQCGYNWHTHAMVDNEKFCPKCGNETLIHECDGDE